MDILWIFYGYLISDKSNSLQFPLQLLETEAKKYSGSLVKEPLFVRCCQLRFLVLAVTQMTSWKMFLLSTGRLDLKQPGSLNTEPDRAV